MSKEITIKAGGEMNQTISKVVEQPSSVEIGPVKVTDDNITVCIVIAVFLFVGAYFIWTRFRKGK
tara:strand:+ start:468 stop:662 length:195 start_codon:yes stop_codon:yes gene_type:complete